MSGFRRIIGRGSSEPEIGEGGPARRIKVDFGTDVDWSFQKDLGVR